MKEIRAYLNSHIFSTFVALMMIIIQGLCVVALIICSNEIVSIGLEGYGYPNGAPTVLSVETYEKNLSALTEEEQTFVNQYYVLLDKTTMTEEEYIKYNVEYPIISSKNLMKKTWIGSSEDDKRLNHVFYMSKESMIYEYINLELDVYSNRDNYIRARFSKMIYAILTFATSSVVGGFVWSKLSAQIGYDQRLKMQEPKGLSKSLGLQQEMVKFGNRFYLWTLLLCVVGLIIYYSVQWRSIALVNNDYIILITIIAIGVLGSVYTQTSIVGILNKGFFLVVKVAMLAIITALFGNSVSVSTVLVYAGMLVLLSGLRFVIRRAQKTIVDAHSENIDNIDGQLTFVVNNDGIEVESVEMKKMVKMYLNNNEYLFNSSWMLEFFDIIDRMLIRIFNFAGLAIGIMAMCYLSIIFGIEILYTLPFLLLLTF